ncbi:MAG: filamentous hemagglutinin N-terminal domain-containing protein [Cyanobacteria bacterium P01_A01_bin.80]
MTFTQKRWVHRKGVQLFSLFVGAIAFSTNSAFAQNITTDGTLRPAKTLTGPNYNILQEDGTTVGSNLFHSFEKFNLNAGESAVFQSTADIQNIISRITGGSASNIDGLLRTQSFNVNLYLINPNGIIFGSNAQIDIGSETRGSFIATTLDSLSWSNGSQFSATNPGNSSSLLTIVGDPSGFLSSLEQPKPIEVTGSKLINGVEPNKPYRSQSLLLVGGDINLHKATLQAEDGRVELGGLSQSGRIGLNTDGNILSLNFPNNVALSSVSLSNASKVDVGGNGGGTIAINTADLNILEGSTLWNGIDSGKVSQDIKPGDIQINATGEVTLDGINPSQNSNLSSGVYNRIEEGASGSSGNISIQANSLRVTDGAAITTSSSGEGTAGNISIDSKQVTFKGEGTDSFPSGAYSQITPGAGGKGGNISIKADSLSVVGGAVITTSNWGKGESGDININVSGSAFLEGERNLNGKNYFPGENPGQFNSSVNSNIEKGAEGQGGDIYLKAGSLSVKDGAVINTSTSDKGNAGNVTIDISGNASFEGEISDFDKVSSLFGSGVYSGVEAEGEGNGGNILLKAGSLSVTKGAVVTTSTDSKDGGYTVAGNVIINVDGDALFDDVGKLNSKIGNERQSSGAYSTLKAGRVGRSGNVSITAENLKLSNGATLYTSTRGKGDAGTLTIDVKGQALFEGEENFLSPDGKYFNSSAYSEIFKSATGNGGNITIKAGSLELKAGAEISTSSEGVGKAGEIFIERAGEIKISGVGEDKEPSGINSKVESSIDDGGGTIRIQNANRLLLEDAGEISAETQSSDGGNIIINLQDLLLMRRNSRITTNAGTAQAGGDGGNITIKAPNGFLVAIPDENSDITANAFSGMGGNVTINSTGVFGLVSRTRKELERLLGTTNPEELNPKELPTSDITAISQANADLDGEVNINAINSFITPEELLSDELKPSRIPEVCQPQRAENSKLSEFFHTRRGGKPPSPNEPLTNNQGWQDLRSESNLPVNNNLEIRKTNNSRKVEIIEAQGIYVNSKGEIYLTRNPNTVTPYRPWYSPNKCGISKEKFKENS